MGKLASCQVWKASVRDREHIPVGQGLLPYHELVASDLVENSPRGARVLDVGHGNGDVLRAIRSARVDLELTGIDGNPDGLDESDPGLRLLVGDFDRLSSDDLPANDVMVCLHVLEHLESPLRFARVLAERMRADNGHAYIGVPNLCSAIPVLNAVARRESANPGHLYGWDLPHYKLFLEAAGLRPTRWLHDSVQFVPGRMRERVPGLVRRSQQSLTAVLPHMSETLIAVVSPVD
ncbi:MAG: methyltransferase domain-containing protein [Actinomycetota bacterium]